MLAVIKKLFNDILDKFFQSRKKFRIGLYGPPNSGKTTLANRICKDILGEGASFGEVSSLSHETRRVNVKDELSIRINSRLIRFDLIDTPGIATRINFKSFTRSGMSEREAKQRAKEATKGVIESIKWLDSVDIVVIVLDSTKNPMSQVNLTIIGNLEARRIPTIIVANKIDLKSSNSERIEESFPKHRIVKVSAKFAQNMDSLYKEILKTSSKKRR